MPILQFSDTKTYTTTHSQYYDLNSKLEFIYKLLEFVAKNDSGINICCSDEPDITKKLIHLFISTQLISANAPNSLLNKYSKLPKDIKSKIKELAGKLSHISSISELAAEDIQLFKESLPLYIPNDNLYQPQRNLKINNLSDFKNDRIVVKEEIIPLSFPNDWNHLEEALTFLQSYKETLLKIADCPDEEEKSAQVESIKSQIKQHLTNDFLNIFSHDLIERQSKLGEIIIVPNNWLNDDEILSSIIIRDKAHQKFDGFAVILSIDELNLVLSHQQEQPLTQIYKISTIMHSTDFSEDTGMSINRLVNHCCNFEQAESKLREITLRQCFSAGRRNPESIGVESKAAVPGEDKASNEDFVRIQNILKHAKQLNPRDLQDLFELQTRATQPLVSSSPPNNALEKLISILKKNTAAQKIIPNLIVKGYFGPMSPYPEKIEAQAFFPANEKPLANTEAPHRFFKAARYSVYDHPEETPAEHIKRTKGS